MPCGTVRWKERGCLFRTQSSEMCQRLKLSMQDKVWTDVLFKPLQDTDTPFPCASHFKEDMPSLRPHSCQTNKQQQNHRPTKQQQQPKLLRTSGALNPHEVWFPTHKSSQPRLRCWHWVYLHDLIAYFRTLSEFLFSHWVVSILLCFLRMKFTCTRDLLCILLCLSLT